MVRIAVTGGSGFVGSHIIEKALELGWEVHSFGRDEIAGTVYHAWEMDPKADYERTFDGYFDAVIHSAAVNHEKSPFSEEKIYKFNVSGTRKALAIDPKARFIYISSASVYHNDIPTDRSGTNASTETELLGTMLNAYSASKVASEKIILEDIREDKVILRPHAIYGERDTSLIPKIQERARKGKLLLPNGGKSLISLTSVTSLVDVINFFVQTDKFQHKIYNVADHQPVILGEVVKKVLALRGVPNVKIINVSRSLAWQIASSKEKLLGWKTKKGRTSKTKTSVLARYLVSQLGYNHEMNISRLEKEMGKNMPVTDVSECSQW